MSEGSDRPNFIINVDNLGYVDGIGPIRVENFYRIEPADCLVLVQARPADMADAPGYGFGEIPWRGDWDPPAEYPLLTVC